MTAKFSVKFWQGLLFNVVHFLGGWLFIIVFVRKRCRPFSTSRDIAFASPGAFFFSFPFFKKMNVFFVAFFVVLCEVFK